MPRPSGLRYKDRVAEHDGAIYFRCVRDDHPKVFQKVIRRHRRADALTELDRVRQRHDEEWHQKHDPSAEDAVRTLTHVGSLVARYAAHTEALVRRGALNEKTAAHYAGMGELLKTGFGAQRVVERIRRSDLSDYVTRLFSLTRSGGASIYKSLIALRTMMSWAGIPIAWKIPTKEINAARRPRKRFALADVQAWIAAMPAGSVERAFVVAKLRTWLRDIELREWTVENVDPEAATVRYREHAKQLGEWRTAHLHNEVIREIEPLLKGKPGPAYVFSFDPKGRTALGVQSLRPRFRSASLKAFGRDEETREPRLLIDSTAWLRSEVITSALDALDGKIGLVSQATEHKHITTTEKYYVDHGRDKVKMKRRVVDAAAGQLPLDGVPQPRKSKASLLTRFRQSVQRGTPGYRKKPRNLPRITR